MLLTTSWTSRPRDKFQELLSNIQISLSNSIPASVGQDLR